MINLTCQPELVAKCILGRDLKETMKNAVVLSLTSKVMQTFINSYAFFEAYAQVMDSGHFLPELKQPLSSFKGRCFELRGLCSKKTEEFPGVTLGDAWVDEEGVKLFSFFKELGHFQLKENFQFNPIEFPKDKPIDLSHFTVSAPSIAKSNEYLAVHGSDSRVHFFNSDGKEYLSTFEVGGDIQQMAIQNNRLYVLSHIGTFYLFVYDLEQQKELNRLHLEYYDQSMPICFGKNYLIYLSKLIIGKGVLVHSLSNLHEKIHHASLTFGRSYYYPMEDGFIEVNFTALFVCDILKISIEEGCIKKTMIKGNLKISEGHSYLRTDVCFHDDRLIMAYRGDVGTKLFSYDLLLDTLSPLHTIPSKKLQQKEDSFKPRFLCMAEKVYYLFMRSIDEDNYKCNFTTLNFSKI
jgi:hypothetical protein